MTPVSSNELIGRIFKEARRCKNWLAFINWNEAYLIGHHPECCEESTLEKTDDLMVLTDTPITYVNEKTWIDGIEAISVYDFCSKKGSCGLQWKGPDGCGRKLVNINRFTFLEV
jgi:hypothetical protein